jgi:hypothetical protein
MINNEIYKPENMRDSTRSSSLENLISGLYYTPRWQNDKKVVYMSAATVGNRLGSGGIYPRPSVYECNT